MLSKTKLMDMVQDYYIKTGTAHRTLWECEEAARKFRQLATYYDSIAAEKRKDSHGS